MNEKCIQCEIQPRLPGGRYCAKCLNGETDDVPQEDLEAASDVLEQAMFRARAMVPGARVYHSRADLFGNLRDISGETALVKYEWPYDSTAEPVRVLVSQLVMASEVE